MFLQSSVYMYNVRRQAVVCRSSGAIIIWNNLPKELRIVNSFGIFK